MRLLAAILTSVLLAIAPVHAEKRVALIIGNAAYKNAPTLQNPTNDAQDVADALKRLGFETIVGLDLDKAGMEEKSIAFARAARDADVALVYYSGHAMQFAGINYLMPVDATLHDEADLRRLARVDDIVADLKQAKNLRILVLDACRDNPLAEELSRSMEASRGLTVDRGLARIIPPSGMIISYATQAGRTAADGRGRNSPYTMAFLKNIQTSDEIGTVFRHITSDVYAATESKQLPELSLSVIRDFYLKGRLEQTTGALPSSEAAQAWAATQGTTSQVVLEDFIKRYGDSFYGTLARTRLEELKKNQVAVVAQPPAVPEGHAFSSRSCSAPLTVLTVSLLTRSAQPLSAAEECALKPKNILRECDKCPEMIVVPAGSFTMGSPKDEPDRGEPASQLEAQVRVTIPKPFAVGEYAMTFDEWDACVADGGCGGYKPSDEGWGRGRRPVINVSWDDAQKYVSWVNGKTGKTYRLLSEAEREYVTRAGTTAPFWWGSTITPKQANYDGTYAYNGGSKGQNRKQTVPVDSFAPNPWGLYNVHGNVYEWTEGCWNDSNNGNPGDGGAGTRGDCRSRILRGGSWSMSPGELRAASRFLMSSDLRDERFGFRVARTLTP
jgi:formylglycine-generating enzyme required for sulfatase activity